MSAHYRIDVDTAALVSTQERLTSLSEALVLRADQLDAAPGSMPVWQGAARTAVMTEVGALAGHTRGFAPLFTAAAQALDPFITAVVDAETNALPDLDQRRQAVLHTFDDTSASSSAQRTTAYQDIPADVGGQRRMWQAEADSAHEHRLSEAAGARDSALGGLDAEYRALVTSLEALAQQASDAVGAAVLTPAPDQTVANHLGGGGRMPLVDLFHDLSAESRQAGVEAAQRLLEQGSGASPELVAAIAARQDDPAFAAGFASAAPPEDLALMVMQWSADRQLLAASAYDPQQLEDFDARYESLLGAVSSTVGTATRGTGEFAPPEGYTQEWVALLTGDLVTEGGEVLLGQSAAAGLLLSRGVFSTPFLDHVATAVYDFEREAGADGLPVWGPRASDGSYSASVVGPGGVPGTDVLASVMHALGRNAQAAQAFLSGGGTTTTTVLGDEVEVQERLQYLLQDRRWPDDADGLGTALVAATTEHRDTDEAGRTSAVLASQAFALAGEVDEPGADGRSLQEGLRDDVAFMLGAYGADVAAALGSEAVRREYALDAGWTSVDPLSGGHGALLAPEHLRRLVATIGSGGSDDLAVVLSGVAAATDARTDQVLAAAMAGDPDAATLLITEGHVEDLSMSLGSGAFAVNNLIDMGLEGEDDEEERVKAERELVSRALGAVASVPGVPGGPWIGYAVAQTVEVVKTELEDVDVSSDYSGQQRTYEDLAGTAVLDRLLQQGYLTPEAYAAAGRPQDAPPPGVVVTGADGLPTFDYGSEAYRTWLAGGRPSLYDFLRDNVENPYGSGGDDQDEDD